jgi:hypothetical protein
MPPEQHPYGRAHGGRPPTCTHYTLQPGTQKFLNPRTGRAPVSGVLIGCTNGFRTAQHQVGVLYHFMGACGRPPELRAAVLDRSAVRRERSDALPAAAMHAAMRWALAMRRRPGAG